MVNFLKYFANSGGGAGIIPNMLARMEQEEMMQKQAAARAAALEGLGGAGDRQAQLGILAQYAKQGFDPKELTDFLPPGAMGGSGQLPASIQIANEIQSALKAGDMERANLLHQVHKTMDRGILPYGMGGGYGMGEPPIQGGFLDLPPVNGYAPTAMPGYGQAAGSIEAAKRGMGKRAEKEVELGYNPAIKGAETTAQKRAEEAVKTETGRKARTALTGELVNMAKHYKELADMGGMVDSGQGSLANLSASMASSGMGQWLGGKFGTQAQELRDKIMMAQPSLMNYIRQASEMGAKGLDSEKELEFYLRAATDPTRSMGANMAALSTLDKAYGLGGEDIQSDPEQINLLKKEFNALLRESKKKQTISQKDLEYTAKKHGITVEEVKRRMGAR